MVNQMAPTHGVSRISRAPQLAFGARKQWWIPTGLVTLVVASGLAIT